MTVERVLGLGIDRATGEVKSGSLKRNQFRTGAWKALSQSLGAGIGG